MKIEQKDQMTLLKIKSLLNYLTYIVKDDDKWIIDEYHTLCRKYCTWGKPHEGS